MTLNSNLDAEKSPSGSVPARRRRFVALSVGILGGSTGLGGCVSVTIYHPLRGLQKPAPINIKRPNFTNTRLTLQCLPGGALTENEANLLCEKLSALFVRQQAQIAASKPEQGETEESESPPAEDDTVGEKAEASDEKTSLDLTVRLEAERSADNLYAWTWVPCILTFSLFPSKSEQTVTQKVTVVDAESRVVATDSFSARFVSYWGVGYWAANLAFNTFVRESRDELTDDSLNLEFSRDFYKRLSQVVYNAKVRVDIANRKNLSVR